MRRFSWMVWLLVPLVLAVPALRFAGGGDPPELGAKGVVLHAHSVKTPWISGTGVVLPSLRLVGFATAREPDDPRPSVADPPFVPPEA